MKNIKITGAYEKFRTRLIESEQFNPIGYEHVLPSRASDARPRSEIHHYIGNSGRLIVVQCWEDGSFQHYLPGKEAFDYRVC
jgi:hypothetical protein